MTNLPRRARGAAGTLIRMVYGFWTVALVTASAAASAPSRAPDPLIEQGEYVARAADCMSCHTAPGGRLFAGGDG